MYTLNLGMEKKQFSKLVAIVKTNGFILKTLNNKNRS